ncbi:class I SAM-dependent methyltransferase [Jiella mangrovi]|uniref:Methyltransferase type 11 n=1 Tax=Jiella mangrovi TaxID=2821407 RepID=A0ABS4BBN8_9HYPH|nr:class I SAM-dependent methyltransferase [Jiella mangrovi]MBP0614169.1 methyltransferase type 11 [Jiella mangrovi]
MSGFAETWLALREPADQRARDPGLMRRALEWVRDAQGTATLVDLGCGAGATLAAFDEASPANAQVCHWRLIDDDPALLGAAMERASGLGAKAEPCRVDLSDVADIPLDGARLVTASALFDLASRDFVAALVDRLAKEGTALYAVLNYDGSTTFSPAHSLDGIVVAGFNRHQLRPKGLGSGASLGPAAARALAEALQARGYDVMLADSPWQLEGRDRELAIAHIEGVAAAVAELGVLDAAELDDWRKMRIANCADGRATVGHLDLLAIPG